jgi:hypothetical protein
VVLTASIALAACGAAPSQTTLKVVERATTDTVADIAPEGDSVGDVLGFANEVFDEGNQTKVGTDNGSCVRTAAGTAWECIWTLSLSDGQLTVEGPFLDAGDSTLAITGGASPARSIRSATDSRS